MPRQQRFRRSAAETREHVLGVAQKLFYWHGIRATGIDKVAAEAGVAPTTLYRLFASKKMTWSPPTSPPTPGPTGSG